MFPLLDGYRGRAKADLDAAVDAILGIADFAVQNAGRIEELDINPLIVCGEGKGAWIADALMVLQEAPSSPLRGGVAEGEGGGWRRSARSAAPPPGTPRPPSPQGGGCRARWRQGRKLMSDVITTRREGAILEVTLDRPKANAIDLKTSRLMGETFQAFRDDPELRVAIVKTAGDKFFCAGWDLKAAAGGDAVDGDYGVGGFAGLQELRDMNKPVIACVNGMAVGGGFELALSCDLIYASDHSSFALPEIKAGTLADAATVKLPKRIPYHVAMDLLLTGRWMDVAEAHRWGLVNEVLPKEKLEDRVWEIARLLAGGPPLVFAAIKEVAREAEAMTFQDAMNWITKRKFRTVDELYASDDNQEGFRAFAEKRDPVWKGK